MKKLHVFLALFSISFLAAGQSPVDGYNCSTIIIGKDASATGHVMIGHNEDDGGRQVVNFYKAYENNKPGDKIILKNGGLIKQVDKTLGYIWLEMPGQDFADSFLNEKGVLITSNSCPSVEREGEIIDGGIGYNLRKIVAERALSARHGVKIAGALISQMGYNASGRTYTIADSQEAWMLSVVRGKHWVAYRIPDNHVVYLPNYYIIREVDFNDKDNYMWSEGLREYAITRKWYDPERGSFVFRDIYGNPRSAQSMSNIGRMWIGVNKLSPEVYEIDDEMPVSFVPARPVGIEDVIGILENHYEGTELDDSNHYTVHNPHENKVMNICAGHQQLSFIAELRDSLPVEIGCRLWLAPRRGCVHPYMPVYYGIKDFLPSYRYYSDIETVYDKHFDVPDLMYDSDNEKAWWAFQDVTAYVDEDYAGRIDERRKFKDEAQAEYFDLAGKFDAIVIKQWGQDRDKAIDDIDSFCNMILQKALDDNNRYMQGRRP